MKRAFYGTIRIITTFKRASHRSLYWANPIQSTNPMSLKYINIVLTYTPSPTQMFFLFEFSDYFIIITINTRNYNIRPWI
jgi:hypothetical protein